MTNIFETPLLLLLTAVLSAGGIFVFRAVFPEKNRSYQYLIPLLIAAAGLGADYFVKTDHEKISIAINRLYDSVQNEDINILEGLISDNYTDTFHDSKNAILERCRRAFVYAAIKKNYQDILTLQVTSDTARAEVIARTVFEKDTPPARNYKPLVETLISIQLKKDPSGRWLITRIELLEVDRQSLDWSRITGYY